MANININWGETITRIIGDGILISLLGFVFMYILNRQNLKLEERKRIDYFLCRNYDKFIELGDKLNQILLRLYAIVRRVEDKTMEKPPKDLWSYAVTVKYEGRDEEMSIAKFIHRYELFIPEELSRLCLDICGVFKSGDYVKTCSKILDVTVFLGDELEIKKNREERKKIFDNV